MTVLTSIQANVTDRGGCAAGAVVGEHQVRPSQPANLADQEGAATSESTNSSVSAEGEHHQGINGAVGKSGMTGAGASGSMHGILKSIVTLAPFVPKMLKDKIVFDPPGGKYAAFDTVNIHDLVGASKTVAPEMEGIQLAMMIADVKGFTALTEILSKKGGSASIAGRHL